MGEGKQGGRGGGGGRGGRGGGGGKNRGFFSIITRQNKFDELLVTIIPADKYKVPELAN
jgi:hypothetical protein